MKKCVESFVFFFFSSWSREPEKKISFDKCQLVFPPSGVGRLEKGTVHCSEFIRRRKNVFFDYCGWEWRGLINICFFFSTRARAKNSVINIRRVAVFVAGQPVAKSRPRSVTETRHIKSPEKRKTAVKCLKKSHFFVFFNYHKNCIIQIKSLGFFSLTKWKFSLRLPKKDASSEREENSRKKLKKKAKTCFETFEFEFGFFRIFFGSTQAQ